MDFKKLFILLFVLFVLSISISGVSADGSFTDLQHDIDESGDILNLTKDYAYTDSSDSALCEHGVLVNKNNYVINGFNHTLDGKFLSKILNITGENITINDITFLNVNKGTNAIFIANSTDIIFNNCAFSDISDYGLSAENSTIILNNVAYYCSNSKGLIKEINSTIYLMNSNFNNLNNISTIIDSEGNVTLYNSKFNNIHDIGKSLICDADNVYIANCEFNNLNSTYATIINGLMTNITIVNSKFSDISAKLTGGVIISKSDSEQNSTINIKDSEFISCSSNKNGGVIYAEYVSKINIFNSTFANSFSDFGGAILAVDSNLYVYDSEFVNNNATFDGAAIYTSYSNVTISNTLFENNHCLSDEDIDDSCGGALYIDQSEGININNSTFINNKATNGGAIFIYESMEANVSDSYFMNNNQAIYGVFTDNYNLKNNKLNSDVLSLNNTFYITVIDIDGVKYVILNNTLNTSSLPESFDLRDYGWVTPVRDQGDKRYCWVFGTCGALESALLKATGLEFDISENNIGNLMLKYSKVGDIITEEAGMENIAVRFLLDWFGASDTMFDSYDQYGKVSPVIAELNDYHVQNVIILKPCKNPEDRINIKEALMKYGALAVCYNHEEPYYNSNTSAYYYNGTESPNHAVTLVGWDDNFSKSNFINTPPGDGAWIIKNSWGTEFGENGYMYISYYDTALLSDKTHGFIINDTIIYNKNYEYDISGMLMVEPSKERSKYANRFTADDDDLIAAVGTYFSTAGEEYIIQVFVNDNLYTQEGVSAYSGYATIPLDKYIKVSKGDSFFVSVESNTSAISGLSTRVHSVQNSSFFWANGTWTSLDLFNMAACLKVYTLDLTDFRISAPELTVVYNDGKLLDISLTDAKGVSVIGAEIGVLIDCESGSYFNNVVTDDKGIAHVSLKDIPAGEYTAIFGFEYGDHQVCMNQSNLTIKNADVNKTGNSDLISMQSTGIPVLVLLIGLFALPFTLRRK